MTACCVVNSGQQILEFQLPLLSHVKSVLFIMQTKLGHMIPGLKKRVQVRVSELSEASSVIPLGMEYTLGLFRGVICVCKPADRKMMLIAGQGSSMQLGDDLSLRMLARIKVCQLLQKLLMKKLP